MICPQADICRSKLQVFKGGHSGQNCQSKKQIRNTQYEFQNFFAFLNFPRIFHLSRLLRVQRGKFKKAQKFWNSIFFLSAFYSSSRAVRYENRFEEMFLGLNEQILKFPGGYPLSNMNISILLYFEEKNFQNYLCSSFQRRLQFSGCGSTCHTF